MCHRECVAGPFVAGDRSGPKVAAAADDDTARSAIGLDRHLRQVFIDFRHFGLNFVQHCRCILIEFRLDIRQF
jgi:hypothetical protein